ncbi:Adaptor protein complex AP-3 delta subunit [Martensiomyces pterosporus]|nr:Adaptor protein complex AP-3 delta subunit [Martensiomyces pterosporus]
MFEKTLTDLIQGLRANKRNEAEYISKSLEEIQNEVQMSDMYYKSTAIDKLNYLHMLGYDMNWANFNVVEVMASSRFIEKRSGYLAASQSFHQETDVLMLTTNLVRKDLASSNVMEVSVALDGLAQIATPELAMDLFDDVMAVLGHSRPYIRKKALVCAYKLVLKHPEGLHAFVPKLKEKLDDPDPSVVSSAVSVICELAGTNPHNYLPLAPRLYHLLNSSSNNWMLIKIVKLFASLTPIEPRLAKKLHGPLSSLICTTSAMSLLYECIHTAVVGDIISVPLPVSDSIGREIDFAELCARKLELFFDSADHNLRYVGLVTLAHLQAKRPDLVVDRYETVLRCLDDPDLSIRMRAMQVISGMATRKNLIHTVKRIMSQLILSNTISLRPANADASSGAGTGDDGQDIALESSITDAPGTSLISAQGTFSSPKRSVSSDPDPADSPEYRLAAVEAVLDMCSRNSYANMTNFEWYVAVLVDLVYISGADVGQLLSERILDVTVRVRQVRDFSVKMMRRLLSDSRLTDFVTPDGPNAKVLCTAAYILGEYCFLLPASADDIQLLLFPGLPRLDGDQQATFIQAAMKAYTNWLQDVSGYWNDEIWELVRSVTSTTMASIASLFPSSTQHRNGGSAPNPVSDAAAALPLQVSSRARQFIEITTAVSVATSNPSSDAPRVCQELHMLFTTYELNPVSAAAQGKVPVPDGLDLDSWIGDAIPDTTLKVIPPPPPPPPQPTYSHAHRRGSGAKDSSGERKARRDRKNEPFYLEDAADRPRNLGDLPDVDDIPVVRLDLGELPSAKTKHKPKSRKRGDKAKSSKKGHRKSRNKSASPSPPLAPVDIVGDEDMPDLVSNQQQQQQQSPASAGSGKGQAESLAQGTPPALGTTAP